MRQRFWSPVLGAVLAIPATASAVGPARIWAQVRGAAGGLDAGAGSVQGAAQASPVGVDGKVGGARVSFLFDRPGLPTPHFLMTVREDGSGRYQADEAAEGGSAGQHVDRTIALSATTTAKIFAAARAQHDFNVVCESKIKHLANTGSKTLTYAGPDGAGSCVYNYSEIKDVQALTDIFLATAFTLDEGRKLEFKKRFDRLGLDAEMAALAHAAEQKQAVELGTIAGVLTGIANDTELMERVRLRAAKLLEQARDAQ